MFKVLTAIIVLSVLGSVLYLYFKIVNSIKFKGGKRK